MRSSTARRWALRAALVLVGLAPFAAAPSSSAAGCITVLPVKMTLPSEFAASYTKTMTVDISSHTTIYGAFVGLYTFGGFELGKVDIKRPFTQARVRIKLRYPMQEGKFSLFARGYPNANPSCGPKHRQRIIRLRGCIQTLPISFVRPPQGFAADYGDYYTFKVATKGPLIRNLVASMYDFDGRLVGRGRLDVLFGRTSIDILLRRALEAGGYTVRVEGVIAQPKSCGPKFKDKTLSFR